MWVSFKGLNENISIGRKAVRQLKSDFPRGFISNSRYKTFSISYNPAIEYKLGKKIMDMRDIVDYKERLGLLRPDAVKQAVLKTNAANCYEQAVLVGQYLSESGVPNELVTMSVYKKNNSYPSDLHAFCLIGLDKGANLMKPDTWGPDSVVVDPWSNTVQKASKAIKQFANMMKFNKKEEKVVFHDVFFI